MQSSLDQMFVIGGGGDAEPVERRSGKSQNKRPFYGEIACQGTVKRSGECCTNQAYYEQDGKFLCGVHSNGTKKQCRELDADPQKKEHKQHELLEWQREVEDFALAKQQTGRLGHVIIDKLVMMKPAPHVPGYLKVFPNYRHGNRVDGFGCATLSPKSLGPVNHGMPDWPQALNLENYHQGAKIFPCETYSIEKIAWSSGKLIHPDAIALRKQLYKDPTPYRHKYQYPGMKKLGVDPTVKQQHLFSVFYHTKTGKERRYTDLECRYFYCHWYEILTKGKKELEELQAKIKKGYNLQIIGYDGRRIERLNPEESLTECLYRYYLDESLPYGHELVLYTILTISDRQDYPWNRFRREHSERYEGYID